MPNLDAGTKAKTYILTAGYACNNNCIMCFVGSLRNTCPYRTTEELTSEIKQAKESGYSKIKLIGGEATIRKDILQLVKCARDLGFSQICMASNGRMFSYLNFCKEIIALGLNEVEISLHGHTPRLHNSIARNPTAFEQAIRGIKNLKSCGIELSRVNSVVSKLNYRFLKEMGYFFESLGIRIWTIMDMIPDGNAFAKYKFLSVRLSELTKSLSVLNNRYLNSSSKLSYIVFNDFPLCVFPRSMHDSDKIIFYNSSNLEKDFQQDYTVLRTNKPKGHGGDKFKAKIAVSKNCVFQNKCTGVWKEYLNLYGDKEISLLVKKYKYTK